MERAILIGIIGVLVLLAAILTVLLMIWSTISFIVENCLVYEEGDYPRDDQ